MIFNKLCLKQKSLLFILFLISIMLFTLYYQHRVSYKNYLYLLNDSYKSSLDNQYKNFLSNLALNYSNIKIHFQNDEIYTYLTTKQNSKLEQKLNTSLQILQKNNLYLFDINILENPTLTDMKLIKTREVDMKEINNNLYYRLLYQLKNNTAIEFLIDTKSFLNNIKEFNNSDGVIHFISKNHQEIEQYLPTSKYNTNFQKLIQSCKSEQKELFNINSKFYVTKSFKFQKINKNHEHNIIFFLDVTKEKLAYKSIIRESITTSILLFIFAAISLNYFFTFLIKRINKNEETLIEINKNLEQTVENEINHRLDIQKDAQDEKAKSEQLLIQQSKLAMMGEMIGNIAHQWRQPLMQLSAIIMYMDAYDEKGKLTQEKFRTKIKEGNSTIDFMSKTIEDFRNYYKPEKNKESFLIKDSIEAALFIIDSSLKNFNINTIVHYDDEKLKITSFKNEFSQALLNIISNAKDVLIQRNIKNPQIIINSYYKNEKIIISIEDNANGINEDIINKIFDPYFTTKHKSQGTGIGLYMTKMIIENNMDGEIEVSNTKKGACFTITL